MDPALQPYSLMKKTYAILGATGKIGHVLTEELLSKGHLVRAIGRSPAKLKRLEELGAEIHPLSRFDDSARMSESFRGADGVFALIPPDMTTGNYLAYQEKVGEAIRDAIRDSGVLSVVSLSSVGAQTDRDNGPIRGLHAQELRLSELKGVNILHLRPVYFMENTLYNVDLIRAIGAMGSAIRRDVPLQMIATRDIAAKAAELLQAGFDGHSVFELFGPAPVTFDHVAEAFGDAIGKPDLKYIEFSYEEARKGILDSGLTADAADLLIEMDRSLNEGKIQPTQQPTPQHRGSTTIEEFAPVFAEAFSQPKGQAA